MNTKKLLLAILLGFKSVTLLGSEEKDLDISKDFEASHEYKLYQEVLKQNPATDPNLTAITFIQLYLQHNKEKYPKLFSDNKQSNQ